MEQAILYRNQGQVVTGVEDERVRQQLLAVLLGERHPVADVESVEVHIQLYGSGMEKNSRFATQYIVKRCTFMQITLRGLFTLYFKLGSIRI